MRNESYIKLYRKITEWEHFKDGNTLQVFLFLLVSAVDKRMIYRGRELQAGQYITSIKLIGEATGLTYMQVRLSLKKLKDTGEINWETVNHEFTVYTVLNYAQYQGSKRRKNKQDDPNRPYDISGSSDF